MTEAPLKSIGPTDIASDPGPNILLMGESGSGKTYSIRSLVSSGIEVRGIFTEPRYAPLRDIPCSDGCHIATNFPTSGSWDTMLLQANNLTDHTWEQNVKMTDKKKRLHRSFISLIELMHNYKCLRCGEEFGDVSEWPNNVALVLDSLSGVSKMCMQMVVGTHSIISQPQWGAMMGQQLQLVDKCCYETTCWFILTAHLERLVDNVQGGTVIQVNALGQKNAPNIPNNFDDVILTRKSGDKFTWSTAATGVATKPTYLSLNDALAPDFQPLVQAWKKGEAS